MSVPWMVWARDYTWICFFCDFFTDSTMVNHHFSSPFFLENMFGSLFSVASSLAHPRKRRHFTKYINDKVICSNVF